MTSCGRPPLPLCTACSSLGYGGSFSYSEPFASITECTACGYGYYSADGGPCQACPQNMYSGLGPNAACTPCPEGSSTGNTWGNQQCRGWPLIKGHQGASANLASLTHDAWGHILHTCAIITARCLPAIKGTSAVPHPCRCLQQQQHVSHTQRCHQKHLRQNLPHSAQLQRWLWGAHLQQRPIRHGHQVAPHSMGSIPLQRRLLH